MGAHRGLSRKKAKDTCDIYDSTLLKTEVG